MKPEEDHYDEADLDDKEYEHIPFAARLAAEQEIAEREMREKKQQPRRRMPAAFAAGDDDDDEDLAQIRYLRPLSLKTQPPAGPGRP